MFKVCVYCGLLVIICTVYFKVCTKSWNIIIFELLYIQHSRVISFKMQFRNTTVTLTELLNFLFFIIIHQELEQKIITVVKSELEGFMKLLSPDYPECSDSEKDQSDVRDGVLKITLHILRNMNQSDLANTLQNSNIINIINIIQMDQYIMNKHRTGFILYYIVLLILVNFSLTQITIKDYSNV